MVKPNKTDTPIITSVPLTAEAREGWLHEQFAEQIGHYGELFIPRDSFYQGKTPPQKANHMLQALCTWLSIKPGYIGLQLEGSHDAKKSKHYEIFVDTQSQHNEFLLAATLAIALTRYWLEEKKQIHLPADEQRALIATASVTFGLGIIIANGMRHDEDASRLLGSIPPSEYAAMLHGYIHQKRLPNAYYHAYLAPWAADLLHIKKPRRPSHAVAWAYANERHERYQLLGLGWVLIIGFSIGIFVFAQRALPQSKNVREAYEQMTTAKSLYDTCRSSHEYNKQYTDAVDIQTERTLNAEAARCQSLKNQYEAATAHYNSLTKN